MNQDLELLRKPSSLYIKSHCNNECLKDVVVNWPWWTPRTKRQGTQFHFFFVCVHTNVGYKVVAKLMCQSEDQASISEALAILKGWNPVWNPTYFMVDYSNAEIAALEEQFPKRFVYICDFHRLQGMHRWCKSKKNGFSSAEQEIF